jgi:hypothetical protein
VPQERNSRPQGSQRTSPPPPQQQSEPVPSRSQPPQ